MFGNCRKWTVIIKFFIEILIKNSIKFSYYPFAFWILISACISKIFLPTPSISLYVLRSQVFSLYVHTVWTNYTKKKKIKSINWIFLYLIFPNIIKTVFHIFIKEIQRIQRWRTQHWEHPLLKNIKKEYVPSEQLRNRL
jgi:hypothetical protein